MADKVTFELVSPERVLASRELDMVVVPGAEGEFGVLPLHAPVMSALRPGTIDMYEGDRVVDRVFVGGGFVEANERGCIVLAEDAEPLAELDETVAKQKLRDAEEDLADAKSPTEQDRERLEKAVETARVRLEVAERRGA